jgi:Lon protease-like protein
VTEPREMPMFPLGTVLFPHGVLPLHVFEPRYRELVRVCLDGDHEFGVVLIERGSEVGGGDVRTDVGTAARIVQATELPDGRWHLVAVGKRRLRIAQWLPDDPYPRAEVAEWDDGDGSDHAGLVGARDDVERRLRRVLALAAELGLPGAEATIGLDADPGVFSWQACVVAPIGPLDAHRLLCAPTVGERLSRLGDLLEEEADVLARRLSGA